MLLVTLLVLPVGFAKDKAKAVLPSYILKAKTVSVLIDPNSGIEVADPQANRTAQKDVETALLKWGRFEPVIDSATAELLIVVRRGNGKVVNSTLPAPQQNRRPSVISGDDANILVGGQRGTEPNSPNHPDTSLPGRPHPQIEAGEPDDSFLVYEGQQRDALDSNPGWRYVAKDGLRPHNVPAVDAFRKAIEDAEKAAAAKP
ncbi:MAG: hypothetical protein ACRYGF_06360 [Janthinobacterium lividum]